MLVHKNYTYVQKHPYFKDVQPKTWRDWEEAGFIQPKQPGKRKNVQNIFWPIMLVQTLFLQPLLADKKQIEKYICFVILTMENWFVILGRMKL